ncbi:MAG: AAA family ATPase [Bacilli bacterium]|nr:AAA family ATPase [Bacilli bacterium]
MKLLRISIHGFKSFADATNIDIKSGITGIVGPNGSGKSNIVDAVKWVLGEQSVKDLRGGSIMSDVIFSGSKSRKPLSRAWASLTLDNSDNYLKSDLPEIEIKRVVYSNGENEYFINNEHVRLKDITNLFIDSGTSVNSLSIISQGKIGEIVNSKPDEKRSILEEAAGVLKYKKRKEETLRKLDKTNDNLSRIDLIIDELIVNLEPLKIQAEAAEKYLKYKNELKETEIALIAHDIKKFNQEHEVEKEKEKFLNEEILKIDTTSSLDDSKISALKLKLLKLEEEISLKSDQLFKLKSDEATLTSEKQVMIERQKFAVDDQKLEANLLALKEKELELINNINVLETDIKESKIEVETETLNYDKVVKEFNNLNYQKDVYGKDLTKLIRENASLNNRVDILKENIENDYKVPSAVRSVINNSRLSGIHNYLGKIIDTEEVYGTALDTALGYSSNIIIVDNEASAKEAINYLKTGFLGRATFFPINIIKPRGIDSNTFLKIKNDDSFIGVASDLVKYEPIYKNIILNQLGNVIVAKNLNGANKLGKLINYMYKIVTLDGELISAGGSITGGSSKNSLGILNQKFELESLLKQVKDKKNMIASQENNIKEADYNLKVLEAKIFNMANNLNSLKETILRKNQEYNNLKLSLTDLTNETKGTKGILNNKLDEEIESILTKYYKVKARADELELKLNKLKMEKNDLNAEIGELEGNSKKASSEYNTKINLLKEVEIKITKLDFKLDNLLLRLNEEYEITYEKASAQYELLDEEAAARNKVNKLKANIKVLGDVNTGSIAEYERISTRYNFLNSQKTDLETSIEDILAVIDELDITMKEKLTTTFAELNSEFKKVFTKLFKGGEGKLILTDPDNILTTGLEIHAVPPGKDIKNTRLLSGGEGTLTAIALLFAILNIRTVPFCILDEVEAALDEVNVDMFGSYLKSLDTNTQFILITHKKRTMEYLNHLYGVTMEESGVSKLVSVKLD